MVEEEGSSRKIRVHSLVILFEIRLALKEDTKIVILSKLA